MESCKFGLLIGSPSLESPDWFINLFLDMTTLGNFLDSVLYFLLSREFCLLVCDLKEFLEFELDNRVSLECLLTEIDLAEL